MWDMGSDRQDGPRHNMPPPLTTGASYLSHHSHHPSAGGTPPVLIPMPQAEYAQRPASPFNPVPFPTSTPGSYGQYPQSPGGQYMPGSTAPIISNAPHTSPQIPEVQHSYSAPNYSPRGGSHHSHSPSMPMAGVAGIGSGGGIGGFAVNQAPESYTQEHHISNASQHGNYAYAGSGGGGGYPPLTPSGLDRPRSRHNSHPSYYDGERERDRGRDEYESGRGGNYSGGSDGYYVDRDRDERGRSHSRSRHHSSAGRDRDGYSGGDGNDRYVTDGHGYSRSHGERSRSRHRHRSYSNATPYISQPRSHSRTHSHTPRPPSSNRGIHHSRSFSHDPSVPYASHLPPGTSNSTRYGDAWNMSELANSLGPATNIRAPVDWDRDRGLVDRGWETEPERESGGKRARAIHMHPDGHGGIMVDGSYHYGPVTIDGNVDVHLTRRHSNRNVAAGGGFGGHQGYGHSGGGSRAPDGGSHQPAVLRKHHRPQQMQNNVSFGDSSGMHPAFCFSRCTGKRKALCIGINYNGQSSELKGCVNDATSVYHFLVNHQHYSPSDIVFLSDEASDPRSQPTRANMISAMRWLVKSAKQHDALFFHYSGHGAQTKDKDGDEVDGYDDVIFPVDYRSKGIIIDDELNEVMVSNLPPGCRLTAVFDSCHSGSVLDLPFLYHTDGTLKRSDVTRRFRRLKASPADVILWSGCKDSETSADTYQGGLAVGAMSYAFIKVLKRNPSITYGELLIALRELLKKKYKQKPQLSASHKIDTRMKFIM